MTPIFTPTPTTRPGFAPIAATPLNVAMESNDEEDTSEEYDDEEEEEERRKGGGGCFRLTRGPTFLCFLFSFSFLVSI